MNGVDIRDQLRAVFEGSRLTKRGGHQALLYLFLLGMFVLFYFALYTNNTDI